MTSGLGGDIETEQLARMCFRDAGPPKYSLGVGGREGITTYLTNYHLPTSPPPFAWVNRSRVGGPVDWVTRASWLYVLKEGPYWLQQARGKFFGREELIMTAWGANE